MFSIAKVFKFFVFINIPVSSCKWGLKERDHYFPVFSPVQQSWCAGGKHFVIQNKKLIFALSSIKNRPIETKIWPSPIKLFLWCQRSNFWRAAAGGSQFRLYKFPRAQPVCLHTAGKLYCLWCWSSKGKHFSRKIYLCNVLFLAYA